MSRLSSQANGSRMPPSHLFKVVFHAQGKVYEIYARKVGHGSLFGFVEVEELVFGERSAVVVDPAEEKIKAEFEGVKRTFLPLHSVIRIDEVRKQGISKISAADASNVTQFPFPVYTPGDSGPRGKSPDPDAHPQRRPRDLRFPARQAPRHDPRPGRPRHPARLPLPAFRRRRAPAHRGRAAGPRIVAALRAAGPGDDARRPAGAGGAALRHGLAVVEQGHRHRARLRTHRSAPHRARRRVLRAGGPAAVAGGVVGGRRRAARPHDRERAARGRRGRGAVRARRAAAAGDGAAAGRGHCCARARQRDAGPGAVGRRDRLPRPRIPRAAAATRRTSS